jgi:transposase
MVVSPTASERLSKINAASAPRSSDLTHSPRRKECQRGVAHAYNIKSHRDQERRWVEQAETAYARFVSGWNPRGPKRVRTGAATEVRR